MTAGASEPFPQHPEQARDSEMAAHFGASPRASARNLSGAVDLAGRRGVGSRHSGNDFRRLYPCGEVI